MLRHLVPNQVRKPFANYSHAVAVPAGARWLVCSGQLGISTQDVVPDDAEAQAALCFDAIGACLAEAEDGVYRCRADQRLRDRPRIFQFLHESARPLRQCAGACLHAHDCRGLHAPGIQS